jgi:hypothetical protein
MAQRLLYPDVMRFQLTFVIVGLGLGPGLGCGSTAISYGGQGGTAGNGAGGNAAAGQGGGAAGAGVGGMGVVGTGGRTTRLPALGMACIKVKPHVAICNRIPSHTAPPIEDVKGPRARGGASLNSEGARWSRAVCAS